MNQISPLGWAAILFVIAITVIINLALVAMIRNLRNPGQINSRIKMPKDNPNRLDLKKAAEILRDPFADERKQLNELSKLVYHQDADSPVPPSEEARENKE